MRREKRGRMTFADIRALIDASLASIPRLREGAHDVTGEASRWSLADQVVAIQPSGSTGILVEYLTNGRLAHKKVFAASPMSVDRIVHTAAEHLTAYTYHRG
jgi:hypothetical protein